MARVGVAGKRKERKPPGKVEEISCQICGVEASRRREQWVGLARLRLSLRTMTRECIQTLGGASHQVFSLAAGEDTRLTIPSC